MSEENSFVDIYNLCLLNKMDDENSNQEMAEVINIKRDKIVNDIIADAMMQERDK